MARPPAVEVLPEDEWNRELVRQLHPADRENPAPAERYALVVIGAGTAGLVSAAGAAGLGAKVALVERHLMGGDCLNFGCVPSKALLSAAHAAHAARSGLVRGGGEVDFGAVMARLRRLRASIAPHDSVARFEGLGVDVFLGEAKFVGEDAVAVGGQTLRFHRCVIATGTRAAAPPIPGLARGEVGGVDYLTNETVFSLTELPQHLLIIGAGPIGCELAQAFRRLGARVTLADMAPRVLPREDPDASAALEAALAREGVNLALGASIARVSQRDGIKVITLSQGEGAPRELVGDALLVAAGRAPNLESLDLVAAGVSYSRVGVSVDDHLRTTNERIFAAGDICSRFQFTHAADALARIALQNALFYGRKKASELVIPWCTYTDPEVAHVGMTADEAAARPDEVQTFTVPLSEVDRAVLEERTDGFARAHVARTGGRLLGATFVGAHAGEAIGEPTLAIRKGLTMADLDATIHPYPTRAEVWKKLGGAWSKTRLTPAVSRVFDTYLGIFSKG